MPRLSKAERGEDTLGGRLTNCRLGKRWTQHQLAASVGTSQAVVQRIETGKCRHPRIITELGEALGVGPAWLMYGVNVIDGLDEEAVETARAWSQLGEPHRSALREMIMSVAADADEPASEQAERRESALNSVAQIAG